MEQTQSDNLLYEAVKLKDLKEKLALDIQYFSSKNIVYLDYPVHNNIGDHLIYWGAMIALKENQNKILAQFSADNYKREEVLKYVEKHNAILVFHGGGNFGDIYKKHHDFRKMVIGDFPDTQKISMPQSVHYNDKKKLNDDLVFLKSDTLVIHVRDSHSFNELKDEGVNVRLTPDCAQALYQNDIVDISKNPTEACLLFRRRDSESAQNEEKGFDWNDLLSIVDKGLIVLIRKSAGAPRLHKLSTRLFRFFSKRIVNKGVSEFSKYEKVDTDRLHGFILSVLLDIPVSHQDNSYQKTARYKKAWLNS